MSRLARTKACARDSSKFCIDPLSQRLPLLLLRLWLRLPLLLRIATLIELDGGSQQKPPARKSNAAGSRLLILLLACRAGAGFDSARGFAKTLIPAGPVNGSSEVKTSRLVVGEARSFQFQLVRLSYDESSRNYSKG